MEFAELIPRPSYQDLLVLSKQERYIYQGLQ